MFTPSLWDCKGEVQIRRKMDFELYKTTRDFSTEYGTFTGLVWGAAFLAFTQGMVGGSLMTMTAGMCLSCLGLIMPVYLAWRYKQHLTAPGDRVSWGMAWTFAFFTLIYASTITGVIQFLYFNFIDKGQLMEFLQAAMSSEEVISQYTRMGAADILEQSRNQLALIAGLSPMELTLNMYANSIMGSIILSIPVAFVAHRKCRDIKTEVDRILANNK